MCRRLLLTLLVIVSIACMGCFRGSVDLTIDESGEVHSKFTMVGMEFMREELEKQRQDLLKGHPNAVVTSVQDGNMTGFSIQMDYEDFDSFAADGVKFYATRPGLCKGIQKKSRWFFDAYALDLFVEGNSNMRQDKETAAMAEAFLSQARFDFTLNLPSEADAHNAETISNSSKTLSWNIVSTLTRGDSKKIHATFKLWNKLHIGMTIGGAVLLLVVAIIFAIQAMGAEGEEKRTKLGFVMGIGGVLLVLGLISVYLLLAPVKFTDGDIISGMWQSEEKPQTTQSSPQVSTPVPKPEQAPTSQPRQTTPHSSTQQNQQNHTPASTKPQNQGVPSTSQSPRPNTTSDLTLANVSIGDSFSTVQQVLGTPYKEETKSDGKKYYFYPSVEVHCQNGSVITLISNSQVAATSRGVHEGSSLQEVLSAYGNDYMKSRYENLDLYEYNFMSKNGLSKVLRFAINPNGRVDYISIR